MHTPPLLNAIPIDAFVIHVMHGLFNSLLLYQMLYSLSKDTDTNRSNIPPLCHTSKGPSYLLLSHNMLATAIHNLCRHPSCLSLDASRAGYFHKQLFFSVHLALR